LKEEEYVNWLARNNVMGIIFEESSQSSVLKHCSYIFRILFKKKCLSLSMFNKVLDYIEEASSDNRQLILRYLESETLRMSKEE
jgi:hypothetical protein